MSFHLSSFHTAGHFYFFLQFVLFFNFKMSVFTSQGQCALHFIVSPLSQRFHIGHSRPKQGTVHVISCESISCPVCSHDLIEAFVVPWPFLISGVQFSKETFFFFFFKKSYLPSHSNFLQDYKPWNRIAEQQWQGCFSIEKTGYQMVASTSSDLALE